MNNTDKIAGLKRTIKQAQAKITEIESQQDNRFKPERGEHYWSVDEIGLSIAENWGDTMRDNECYENFNCFETEELATKASVMMTRNNAIIMACSIVDPDFVPDYLSGNQEHYSFYYLNPSLGHDGSWCKSVAYQGNRGPCVSTQEKWEEAAALLKEWGVE